MILTLDVPQLRSGIEALDVLRWRVDVGDLVEFGSVVVELAPHERIPKQLRDAASTLGESMIDAGSVAAFNGEAARATEQRLHLVASDRGVLRAIVTAAGRRIQPGAQLALISTTPDEPLDGAPLRFRVVAEFVDPEIDLELG